MGEYADIKDRIKQLRTSRGMSQQDLADNLGVTNVAVSQWERGVKQPKMEMREALCDLFNVNMEYLNGNWDKISRLVTEDEALMIDKNRDIPVIGSTRIPVYSAAGAGKPQPTSDDILFYTDYNGDPDGVLGVQIKGDSMAPTIPDNSLVIVNSNLQIESGDIVVAQVNSDHEALCKRIKKYEDGLSLISDNPAYPPLYFTAQQVQELPVRFVGKCTEVRKKL